MTLTPPFGDDAAARSRARRLLVKKSPTDAEDRSLKCRSRDGQKNHRTNQTLLDGTSQGCSFISCQARRRKNGECAPALRGGRDGCFPAPNTRAVICNAASCAGVRSAEPPAHESPPSPRVPRVRRPGSSNITASCVRAGVCAVTLAADPACAPGRAARAPACRHPSRPPLTGAPQKVGA